LSGSASVRSGRRPSACIALALAVTAALTACGATEEKSPGTPASTSTAADTGCGYAYVFQEPLASNTAEQTVQRGLKRTAADFHTRIDITDGTGLSGLADNLRAAAAKGCYKAIGTAFFSAGEALTQVAKDYPKQQFFIEGGVATGPNVTSYAQANEQGTYVAGAMAAKLSATHTIGIITGDDSPPLKRFSVGFVAGAHSVDPNVNVLTNAVGTFTDPAKTGAIAVTQAGKKADLIYPAAGSNLQVYFLGQTHGYRTIGSDLTDYGAAKARKPALGFVAASAEDNLNYAIIKQYVSGRTKTDSTTLGLKDGVFSIPYVTDGGSPDYKLPPDVIAAGKKAYDDVVNGKVKVPTT
jgi:basic membrane protein A